jgi:HAMP domain-containing protein
LVDARARTDDRPPKAALRLPRIPLPAKLLISYLLLLALAAVPNVLYVRSRLEKELVDDAERELLETARRSAGVLAPLNEAARIAHARELALMTGQRVTLVAGSGAVLMDSETPPSTPLALKSDRPEILEAAAKGSGVARRVSDTTHLETLYAAARLPVTRSDEGAAVVRVARGLASVRTSTEQLTRFARNVQAAAISVALLLSLFAAMQFVRPLQRVIAAARALGAGDLAARSGVSSDDEVGDAGRALDAMAAEIRRRLASAGSGDAVLSQLVDAVPIACVIFEVTGEVLALNGVARTAFRVEGPNASKRLKDITSSPDFERALEMAEGDGEPEPLEIDVGGVRVRGRVHVLKRPGTAPFYVLLGESAPRQLATTLPPFENVRPRALTDVLAEAGSDAAGVLASSGVALEVGDAPAVVVVDVDHRVRSAIAAALGGCARAVAGRQETLAVDVKVESARVRLTMESDPGRTVVDGIRPLLEPLGGGIEVDHERATTLWIPRA